MNQAGYLAERRMNPTSLAMALAIEGAIIVERGSINDFDRPISPKGASGEPDFAVAALADASYQRVVRDDGLPVHNPERDCSPKRLRRSTSFLMSALTRWRAR